MDFIHVRPTAEVLLGYNELAFDVTHESMRSYMFHPHLLRRSGDASLISFRFKNAGIITQCKQ